ncbi:MAG TPA: DUF1810 domain-containing protein [Streptosporangiaceae bacterium]|nr:DUF1810 domain-containing protein [Streptosporangiaceae bacterium]
MTAANSADPYDLRRFAVAQDSGGTYQRAVAELRAGRKTGHWMWFVFPQIAGLGFSPTSRTYAIRSLAEARAYLRHPVLGPRLTDCARILTKLTGSTAERVFGDIDATKLRSSMTLFRHADPGQTLFGQVLDQYFDGQSDPLTDRAVAAAGEGEF